MIVPCPICKKPVEQASLEFPFCSQRCRLLDLGKWASEDYRIPAQPMMGPIEDLLDE